MLTKKSAHHIFSFTCFVEITVAAALLILF